MSIKRKRKTYTQRIKEIFESIDKLQDFKSFSSNREKRRHLHIFVQHKLLLTRELDRGEK